MVVELRMPDIEESYLRNHPGPRKITRTERLVYILGLGYDTLWAEQDRLGGRVLRLGQARGAECRG